MLIEKLPSAFQRASCSISPNPKVSAEQSQAFTQVAVETLDSPSSFQM